VRRLGGLIALLFLVVPTGPARAQDEGSVSLKLVRQTSFATTEDLFKVRVAAANSTDQVLRDLALRVTVFPPARSRSAYAEAIEFDGPFFLEPTTQPVEGTVEPDSTRLLPLVGLDLHEVALSEENVLLPVKVELLSGGIPLALLRTAAVFIEQEPFVPLNVGLTVVLDAPLRMLPDGTFVDGALEDEVTSGGSLEVLVSALEGASFRVTVVVSPVLLEQLRQMSDGYRILIGELEVLVDDEDPPPQSAASMLERIREIAARPATELVAMPYAAPSVPSLTIPQLGEDLQAQISRGRRTVTEILGVAPSETLFHPPGGAISDASVEALADVGMETLLLDQESVEPLQDADFSPPSIALVEAGPTREVRAIVPDPGVAARMQELPEDPRLRAQRLIGELSAIYFEFPSDDRGVAILIDGGEPPGLRFLSSLVRALTALPDRVAWLRPVDASRLLTTIDPELEEPPRRQLNPSPGPRFSATFLSEMAGTQEALQQFAAVAGAEAPLLERLRILRFTAESRWLLHDEGVALRYLRASRNGVEREFAKIEAPPPTPVTLTSNGGPIPVTIRTDADYPMRIRIELHSSRPLEFIGGSSREVTLSRTEQLYTFRVRAQTTGRFPVQIQVKTPIGELITESQIVIRSTAYNQVALIVTIGAALFLAAWWGRRFLPRRS
jgi:hypothetical protein